MHSFLHQLWNKSTPADKDSRTPPSIAMTPKSRKIFTTGIKPLFEPEKGAVEYATSQPTDGSLLTSSYPVSYSFTVSPVTARKHGKPRTAPNRGRKNFFRPTSRQRASSRLGTMHT